MPTNPLTGILSPSARKSAYAVYAAIGLLVGCIQVGYGSLDAATPAWLKVTLAIYAFIGTAIGATAASNVKPA
ncbi:MAG: hypothetical protein ABI776_13990 [Nocardioidaceae bacterium]